MGNKKLQEILNKVNEKKLEYIINQYEAQEIICGINFLLSKNFMDKTTAEEHRLEKIAIAIDHKVDCSMEPGQINIPEFHEEYLETYFDHIVKDLIE